MPGESSIEHSVIRNRAAILGVSDSLYIRRTSMGPGFGVADLVILPQRGKHKLIIVEAKLAASADAKVKVLGQLLMYYVGALNMGLTGVKALRRYAVESHRTARSARRSSLKALSGGVTPREAAWATLQKGRRLVPHNVRLVAALDSEPGPVLKESLEVLAGHYGLRIDVVSVLGRDKLELWTPGNGV